MSTWKWVLRKFGPLIGLVLVVALFAALRPRTFLTLDNMQIMFLHTAVVATAAMGMTMIIIGGGIDLSVGSNIALACVVVALLLAQDVPPALAAAGAIVGSALIGAAIGGLITGLRLTPFIVTLGAWGAVRGAAKGLADEQMVLAPHSWLNGLLRTLDAESRWMIFPPGVWIMLGLAGLTAATLHFTRFGRHVFAIGSNEQTARLCGVHVARTKLLIYVIGGATAGIAGVLQFARLSVGDPTTASGLELDVIAAVVIGGGSLAGGQGSVLGSIIGALIMTVVANGCTKMELPNWVQEIVTGGIIVAAVTLDQLRRRRG